VQRHAQWVLRDPRRDRSGGRPATETRGCGVATTTRASWSYGGAHLGVSTRKIDEPVRVLTLRGMDKSRRAHISRELDREADPADNRSTQLPIATLSSPLSRATCISSRRDSVEPEQLHG